MAFEEGLGYDESQPRVDDYKLSATGLVSKTLDLWTRRFVQYVLIVGIVGVATTLVSFVVLFTIFGSIGILSVDPISYLINIFALPTSTDMTLIIVTVVFAVFAFIINAILSGAAIKFALDDYGGQSADIRLSFSHSFGKVSRLVTVQLLMTLIVSIVTAPSLALMGLALDGIDISDPWAPIITPEAIQYMMMGMVLLLVGGIFMLYFTIRLAPTLAIVVDTDLSAIDSLKKSWNLTSGNFLHVFGGQLLIGLVIGILTLIAGVGISALLWLNPFAIVVEVIVTSLLFTAPSLIYIAVLYRDLMSRSGPEGSELPAYVL